MENVLIISLFYLLNTLKVTLYFTNNGLKQKLESF